MRILPLLSLQFALISVTAIMPIFIAKPVMHGPLTAHVVGYPDAAVTSNQRPLASESDSTGKGAERPTGAHSPHSGSIATAALRPLLRMRMIECAEAHITEVKITIHQPAHLGAFYRRH